MEIINARVKQKVGTEAQWLSDDTILLEGEQAFVINNEGQSINFKIGDGTKRFSELEYFFDYSVLAGKTYPIKPTDPAPELDGIYIPTVVGVYPNMGGLERLASDGYVQFLKNGAVYAKVNTPMPQAENKIPDWVNTKAYTAGQQVVYGTKIFKVKAGQTSPIGTIPVNGAVWETIGGSTEEVLNIIGDFPTEETNSEIDWNLVTNLFTDLTSGYATNSNTVQSSARKQHKRNIPVVAGQKYYLYASQAVAASAASLPLISTVIGYNGATWGVILPGFLSTTDTTPPAKVYPITIPEGITLVSINTQVDSTHKFFVLASEIDAQHVPYTGGTVKEYIDTNNIDVKSQVKGVSNLLGLSSIIDAKWSIGSLTTSGVEESLNTRIRTDFIEGKKAVSFKVNDGYKYSIRFYNQDKSFVGLSSSSFTTNEGTWETPAYFRVILAKQDDSVLTDTTIANQLTMSLAKTINTQWVIGTIGNNGMDSAMSSRLRSDFIKGNRLVSIRINAGYKYSIRYYDQNRVYVGGMVVFDTKSKDFAVPAFFRLVIARSDDGALTDTSIASQISLTAADLSGGSEVLTFNPYLAGNYTDYYASPNYTESVHGAALTATTITDVYNRYDAIAATHWGRMKRTLLGYGGDANNNPNTDLPIYEYAIKTLGGNGLLSSPTILITSGVHGEEKSAVWSTMLFFEQLMNNWESHAGLASIFSNVNIKIIPVVNPSGFNTHTRPNARGVDINRNMSYKWAEYDGNNDPLNAFPSNKGTAVYSELEAQIVRDWLIANRNAIAYLDYHNTATNLVFTSTPNVDLQYIFSNQLRRLTFRWGKRYSFNPQIDTVGYVSNFEYPMVWREGIVQGIKHSALLEVGRIWEGQEYSAKVIERGQDLLCNYLLGILDMYTKKPYSL